MRNYSYLCAKILKTMRKVIGIGETVLDIIFRDEQPISALPGGSTFNAIISLGRCGVETRFISSGQQFSAEVCHSLHNYVSPQFGHQRRSELQSALAASDEA